MNSNEQKSRQGFTLIELLIVVAIIAILAAIAVPNFLEAQVRSKVSRLKADMRSTAVAIEAYAVDWNRVPPGKWERLALTGNGTWQIYYGQMTTPVAYMTSVPKNPFTDKMAKGGAGNNMGSQSIFAPPEYNSIAPGPNLALEDNQWSPGGTAFAQASNLGYTWFFEAIGPSQQLVTSAAGATYRVLNGLDYPADIWVFYDPSNGTTSEGYISRTNKGQI